MLQYNERKQSALRFVLDDVHDGPCGGNRLHPTGTRLATIWNRIWKNMGSSGSTHIASFLLVHSTNIYLMYGYLQLGASRRAGLVKPQVLKEISQSLVTVALHCYTIFLKPPPTGTGQLEEALNALKIKRLRYTIVMCSDKDRYDKLRDSIWHYTIRFYISWSS